MNVYQMYRQTQAETASPAELVVMLYRGAVRFAAAAVAALETGELETAHNSLVRTQAIVTELHGSLDHERGGEIAQNLGALYRYIDTRLVEANVQKSPEPARDAERLLRELLEAWEQVTRQASEGNQPVAAAA